MLALGQCLPSTFSLAENRHDHWGAILRAVVIYRGGEAKVGEMWPGSFEGVFPGFSYVFLVKIQDFWVPEDNLQLLKYLVFIWNHHRIEVVFPFGKWISGEHFRHVARFLRKSGFPVVEPLTAPAFQVHVDSYRAVRGRHVPRHPTGSGIRGSSRWWDRIRPWTFWNMFEWLACRTRNLICIYIYIIIHIYHMYIYIIVIYVYIYIYVWIRAK